MIIKTIPILNTQTNLNYLPFYYHYSLVCHHDISFIYQFVHNSQNKNKHTGPFGAGRFYIEDYDIAVFKLFLPTVLFCLTWVFIDVREACEEGVRGRQDIYNDDGPSKYFMSVMGAASCSICIAQIWWLVDWILFAANVIPDGHGKTLYPI